MLAAYAAAVDRLPVVSRVIFLLHRVDDLSYGQIAQRLSISSQSVQACVAEALGMIATIMDGDTPRRWRAKDIAPVEKELRRRYRISWEGRLQSLGHTQSLAWDSGRNDGAIVTAALLQTLPAPVLETFLLHQVDGLTYRQIARRMRTFPCIVRRRMLHAIRYLDQQPISFEQWLCAGA
jgi:DNA-directed RNA polymerase specialized sigma24 family protein